MTSILGRCTAHKIALPSSRALPAFQPGEFDPFGGLYCVLNAIHIATGGLKQEEALKAFRLAIGHLADRRTAIETFSMGMAPQRLLAISKLMSRAVSNEHRQVQIEQAQMELLRSPASRLSWIEQSLVEGMPVVTLLDAKRRRIGVIVGISRGRLFLFESGTTQSIEPRSGSARRAFNVLGSGMFRIRVVKLEPIFPAVKRQELFGHRVMVNG